MLRFFSLPRASLPVITSYASQSLQSSYFKDDRVGGFIRIAGVNSLCCYVWKFGPRIKKLLEISVYVGGLLTDKTYFRVNE